MPGISKEIEKQANFCKESILCQMPVCEFDTTEEIGASIDCHITRKIDGITTDLHWKYIKGEDYRDRIYPTVNRTLTIILSIAEEQKVRRRRRVKEPCIEVSFREILIRKGLKPTNSAYELLEKEIGYLDTGRIITNVWFKWGADAEYKIGEEVTYKILSGVRDRKFTKTVGGKIVDCRRRGKIYLDSRFVNMMNRDKGMRYFPLDAERMINLTHMEQRLYEIIYNEMGRKLYYRFDLWELKQMLYVYCSELKDVRTIIRRLMKGLKCSIFN